MEHKPNKRIEYIDALRGFTMYLVVYSHIWTFGYKTDETHSFENILTNFFLILFFFISGFCAYKDNATWTIYNVGKLLRKKFIQLMVPTGVFFAILCYWRDNSLAEYLKIATAEYWFTFQLFIFFFFYYATMLVLHKSGSIQQSISLLIIAFLIYLISFSHVLIESTELGANVFHYLGMGNWREYMFFTFGVLARKLFEIFKNITENAYIMAGFILLFFFLVFCAAKIGFPLWKPIRMLLYGSVSIVVIFTFFRKYEPSFSSEHTFGCKVQYVGKRTLDIYMIHYFFLPRNLDFLGKFFVDYSNPSLEFFVTTILSIIIIWISLVVGNTVRLSPKLAHYILGDK